MTVLSYLDANPETFVPLTMEQSKIFINCIFCEMNEPDALFTKENAYKCGDIGKILYHRLMLSQEPVYCTLFLALFIIMSLTDGIPGKIVMWGYTLNRMFKKKNDTLRIKDLTEYFQMGFPSEKEQERLWDEQKGYKHNVQCDNMVDQVKTWQ